MAVPDGGPDEGFTVNLRMEPGELVGLEVPSARDAEAKAAAQATALARTVVGLADPRGDKGAVWVGARQVTGSSPADRQVGYVPAPDGLLPSLTVQRNIWCGLPPRGRDQRRRRLRDRWPTLSWPSEPQDGQARDRIARLATALDLGPALHLRPHELDPAQRFHAAVVRALARLHEVVVVDLPRPVPGALPLHEILDRVRRRVRPTETTAVLVCTIDARALGELDRTVRLAAGAGGGP